MAVHTKNWFAIVGVCLAGACGDSSGAGNDGDRTTVGSSSSDDVDAGSQCGAQADGKPRDTSAMGGCYYFYCQETESSLLAAAMSGGACANATDVAIQCEGQSVLTVSECARKNSGVLLLMGEQGFKDAVTKCAQGDSKLSADFSDACLDCNVQSSLCAAQKCLGECVMGDSKLCDSCRETKGCTPDFYTCAGLPDPNKP